MNGNRRIFHSQSTVATENIFFMWHRYVVREHLLLFPNEWKNNTICVHKLSFYVFSMRFWAHFSWVALVSFGARVSEFCRQLSYIHVWQLFQLLIVLFFYYWKKITKRSQLKKYFLICNVWGMQYLI